MTVRDTPPLRVLALDHGEARCGCAVSDPSGTLATPLRAVERPETRRGLVELARLVREHRAELVLVGLPLTLAGEEGAQAARSRAFAEQLSALVPVPVELHDERLTSRLAERPPGPPHGGRRAPRGRAREPRADRDSRAAAHLLESYLATSRPPAAEGGAR
jgi:putative Holliday junction resolvase